VDDFLKVAAITPKVLLSATPLPNPAASKVNAQPAAEPDKASSVHPWTRGYSPPRPW